MVLGPRGSNLAGERSLKLIGKEGRDKEVILTKSRLWHGHLPLGTVEGYQATL